VDFDPFLMWIEDGWLSVFLRETDFGFSGPLAVHIIGVALVAGPTIAASLALLGVLPGVPLAAFKRFLPIFWLGLCVSAPSGLLLLIAYPTKSLTNPLFYVKLVAILAGIWTMVRMRRRLAAPMELPVAGSDRNLGLLSLGLWAFVIAAGRLLAYTYGRLMLGF
jgi:hypothetical protein